MREGRVFKRCATCRREAQPDERGKRCAGCGAERMTWCFRVDVSPPGAPRKQVFRQRDEDGQPFPTKAAARAAAAELQRRHRRGEAVEPSRQTVGHYLAEWVEGMRREYRPSTWDTAKLHIDRYIAPRVGDVPLQALTRHAVKALYAELAERGSAPRGKNGKGGGPLSDKYVHNIHRTLCRALNDAVEDRLLLTNPAAKAHKMPESPEQPTWTAAQLRTFYASVADDRWFAMWRCFGASGMRRGEGAGLRWLDVDLEAARLTLVEARVKGHGGVTTGRLKGKRGRSVSLDPVTVAALRAWKAQQAAERLAWPGEWAAGDLVFTHPDGTPLHPDSITKTFKKRVKAAGLPWVKLHGLRHTHATIALGSGENIRLVADRLGHSSIQITGDVYAHVTPEMDAQAAARVAALVDGPS